MRNICDVINIIIEEIPLDYKNRESFVTSLEKLNFTCQFTAPELMTERWFQFQSILINEIGVPLLDWQKKIAHIFNDI